ncbi:hypothetical protein MSAN_01958600 [Mycena sanguinolenta]|uniref:Uncharacterized protein n=1 Tax=Mycena sanguinolenta TaxID=230812 RepID=A0A8H6XNU6_9AGAR|nr:hypothetical protein MSAN_01958600 [Mycena sanguinolenta]
MASKLLSQSRVLSIDSEEILVDSPIPIRLILRSIPLNTQRIGAGATEKSPQNTRKPNLYQRKRGPLRRATNNGAERGTQIVSANASNSRTRNPTYATLLRTLIKDVMARKLQEEDEERQLRELLKGRVVGGADKFGCVKVRSNTNLRRGC